MKTNELHLTVHMKGKLKGILSINTSSLKNAFCNSIGCRHLARKDRHKKTICEYCYAEKNEKVRKQLEVCLEHNTEMLTTRLLTDSEIPLLNNAFVRFHSFGELVNDIHVQNFLNIAKKNSHATFCLMTKRYNLIMNYPKLKNVIYIASSPVLNTPIQNKSVLEYFDKVFTVYEQDNACVKQININCHGRDCMKCQNCYTTKGDKNINEILRK